MRTIDIGIDVDGVSLKVGDKVFADDGMVQGVIETIWDNGTIDIWHANAHQGPVVDTFDIIGNNVIKKEIDTGD